jgi:hypothetical protein
VVESCAGSLAVLPVQEAWEEVVRQGCHWDGVLRMQRSRDEDELMHGGRDEVALPQEDSRQQPQQSDATLSLVMMWADGYTLVCCCGGPELSRLVRVEVVAGQC